MEPQAEGEPKPVTCGHPVSDHDSGGCCRVNRCPCSHLVLSKQDEFDPAEPKATKEINPLQGKAKQ
jgi:hypothetical protein